MLNFAHAGRNTPRGEFSGFNVYEDANALFGAFHRSEAPRQVKGGWCMLMPPG